MHGTADHYRLLIDRLIGFHKVSPGVAEAVRELPLRYQRLRRHDHIIKEGQRASICALLISGHACRYKMTKQGEREIVSFHVPTDLLDLQHLLFATADHSLQMISDGEVCLIPMDSMLRLVRQEPDIATAWWRETLIEASIFREWMLNVARRDALQRISHIFCEFVTRCEVLGLCEPITCDLPFRQADLADATGLTPVHVNRSMKILRDANALQGSGQQFRVGDWDKLKNLAEFDPTYLHIETWVSSRN